MPSKKTYSLTLPAFSMTKKPKNNHYTDYGGSCFLIVIGTLKHMGGAERQATLLGLYLKEKVNADVKFLAWTGGETIESILKEVLHHQRYLFMNFLSLFFEQTIVNDFMGEGVLEHILQIGLRGPDLDQINSLQNV